MMQNPVAMQKLVLQPENKKKTNDEKQLQFATMDHCVKKKS